MSIGTAVEERLRRVVRGVLPRGGFLALAEWYNRRAAVAQLGRAEYDRFRGLFPDRCPADGGVSSFSVPSLEHPIAVRHGTSDLGEVLHTVLRGAYRFAAPPADAVRLVIDAGANVGDSTSLLLSMYPGATVVAVEPDDANFAMLERNCRGYGPRAVLVKGGLWPRGTTLGVVGGGAHSDITLGESPAGGVRGYSPLELLAMTSAQRIDYFKIDIEGAERVLFADGCDDWLRVTDHLAIDVHGRDAGEIVAAAMRRHPFRGRRYRELFVYTRRAAG